MGSNTVNVGPSDFYKVKSFYRIRDKSRERKARALADWTGKPRLLSDFRFLFLHLACGFSGVGVKSGLQPEESLTAGWTVIFFVCPDLGISCFVSGKDHFCRLNNMSLIC